MPDTERQNLIAMWTNVRNACLQSLAVSASRPYVRTTIGDRTIELRSLSEINAMLDRAEAELARLNGRGQIFARSRLSRR